MADPTSPFPMRPLLQVYHLFPLSLYGETVNDPECPSCRHTGRAFAFLPPAKSVDGRSHQGSQDRARPVHAVPKINDELPQPGRFGCQEAGDAGNSPPSNLMAWRSSGMEMVHEPMCHRSAGRDHRRLGNMLKSGSLHYDVCLTFHSSQRQYPQDTTLRWLSEKWIRNGWGAELKESGGG